MKEFILILVSSVLVNNYVLSQTLGICPFLGVSKKLNQAVGMGMAVTFVMVIATAVTWPIQNFILSSFDLGYLQTIVFILVIAALVQLVELFLKKAVPALHKALGVYLPLITTNCAVLAVCINALKDNNVPDMGSATFLYALLYAFGSGIGFLLAMVMFAGVRERIAAGKPPKAFEGTPITLISAAIVSFAFLGFEGLFSKL